MTRAGPAPRPRPPRSSLPWWGQQVLLPWPHPPPPSSAARCRPRQPLPRSCRCTATHWRARWTASGLPPVRSCPMRPAPRPLAAVARRTGGPPCQTTCSSWSSLGSKRRPTMWRRRQLATRPIRCRFGGDHVHERADGRTARGWHVPEGDRYAAGQDLLHPSVCVWGGVQLCQGG